MSWFERRASCIDGRDCLVSRIECGGVASGPSWVFLPESGGDIREETVGADGAARAGRERFMVLVIAGKERFV